MPSSPKVKVRAPAAHGIASSADKSAKPKKLYRSRANRIIAGVCGGLGEYFSIDATIVRLVFAATIFFGGGGAFVYLLLWAIVPREP